jgi:hypothetical protein
MKLTNAIALSGLWQLIFDVFLQKDNAPMVSNWQKTRWAAKPEEDRWVT